MRANAGIFIIICLLFLVGTVAAVGIPDTVTVTTNKPWIVANNVDTSTITVTVTNTTTTPTDYSGPVPGVTINLAVDPLYGTLTPTTVTTDVLGKASSTFKVKTKSGAPQITATALGLSGSTIQNIDHDVPATVNLNYPLEGEVASEVPFNISIIDRWENPIDGRNTPIHSVSLRCDGPDGWCGFKDGILYPQTLSRPLDINGNLSVQVRLSKFIGENNIQIASPFTVVTIVGIATGVPYRITGSISPSGSIPVGNQVFTITYILYDEYGNPTGNRMIWMNSTLTTTPESSEQLLKTSNSNGLIQVTYGPKTTVQTVPITAISIDNQSVRNEIIAIFVSAPPVNMVLAVTPTVMASREIKPTEQAFVRATVFDTWGNPNESSLVTFSLGTVDNGTTPLISSPALSAVTATTDHFGNAIVNFYPGSFPSWNEPGYNPSATGSVPITATWNGIPQTITATWKNYPYLSIETSVAESNIVLNDTINITIDVIGNGFNMPGGQVTAILDLDCTSNMFSNKDPPYASRADSAKAASDGFVIEMLGAGQQNWIGLTSFGTEKNDQFHLPPQHDLSLIQLKISNLVKGTNAGDFGPSITDAMLNITTTTESRGEDKIRAVVILNDGGSNLNNQGELDAIVAYANAQNPPIQLFTVLYYDGSSSSANAYVTLKELADRTTPSGGPSQFFHSKNPAELAQAFIDIAKILKTAAGVNAKMTLDFTQVNVNSQPMSGGNVFSYVPLGTAYPMSDSHITSRDDVTGRTRIIWPNSSHSVINQSNEWNFGTPPYQLHFDIGRINISQRWNTTYTLRVNQTGLIDIFNCTLSAPTFLFEDENGIVQAPMCLPNLFITVNDNKIPQGLKNGTLDLSDLIVSGTITDTIPLQWNLTYTGNYSATETISYSYNDGHKTGSWVVFDTKSGISPSTEVYTHTAQLNIQGVNGGSYRIKVHADTPDAGSKELVTQSILIAGDSKYFLLLK